MAKNDNDTKVYEAAKQWEPTFPMVLDRIGGTWVVTGWTTDSDDCDVTFRLRISFSPDEETVLFQCDVAPDYSLDFVQMGEARFPCFCGFAFIDDVTLFGEDGVPELWLEFREMARRWYAVSLILDPMDEYVPALAPARPGLIGVFSTSQSSTEQCQ